VKNPVDGLYGVPLSEFIAARNKLAKRLKAEGNETGAAAVRKLGKPSISAWAVNQVARRKRAQITKLISASDDLRAAHSKGGTALRDATRARNQLVARLVDDAADILTEAGHSAARAQLDKVTATLQAASTGEEYREDLIAGRLTADLQSAGFGELAGWEAPEGSGQVTRMEPPELRKARRLAEDTAARAESAEDRADRLAEVADDQRRRADDAAAEAKSAKAAARAARKKANDAAKQLAKLEQGR
jgi:hypothetical protein